MLLVLSLIFTFIVNFTFSTCPKNALPSYNNTTFCYYFMPSKTSYFDAETLCQNLNGHLVSICDSFTNAYIRGKIEFPTQNRNF